MRQRRLSRCPRALPRGVRLGGEARAAGQADRRALSRHRVGCFHRRRRRRAARRTARLDARGGRHGHGATSARRRSGRGWRPCWRRSPPTRSALPLEQHPRAAWLDHAAGTRASAPSHRARGDGRLGGARGRRRSCVKTICARKRPRRLGFAMPKCASGTDEVRRGQQALVVARRACAGPARPTGSFANTAQRTYTYGAHAAHVAVDPRPATSSCSTMSPSRMSAASSTR